MVDPSGDEQNTVESRYALVMAVAKRAKQIREGAPKLVDCKSRNPITIAMEEIKMGKLKMVVPTAEEMEAAGKEIVASRQEPLDTADLLKITEEDELDIDDGEGLLDDILLNDEKSDDLAAALGDVEAENKTEEDNSDAVDAVAEVEDDLDADLEDEELESDVSEVDDQEE